MSEKESKESKVEQKNESKSNIAIDVRIEELRKEFDIVKADYDKKTEEYNAYSEKARTKLIQLQGAYLELEKLRSK